MASKFRITYLYLSVKALLFRDISVAQGAGSRESTSLFFGIVRLPWTKEEEWWELSGFLP